MNADLEQMRSRIIADALRDVRARGERQALVSRIHRVCDEAVEARRAALLALGRAA